MRVDEVLRPELILCRRPPAPGAAVLQELGERVGAAIPGFALADLLDPTGKRRRIDPMPLGKGVVLYHLRTEKVPDLTLALATVPEGILELAAPDAVPVRAAVLFLVPKKHSERYLSALAALVEALSTAEVLDRVVQAEVPGDIITALSPVEILSVLTSDGGVQDRLSQMLARMSPPELADVFEDTPPKVRGRCLASLPPQRAAEVTRFMYLSPLAASLRRIPPDAAARILSFVPSARCADVLQRMQPEEQAPILKQFVNGGQKSVQMLLKYPPHTAGGIMTPEVLSVPETATVADALKRVAAFQDRRQTAVYVTSTAGRLLGYCQFHALAGAEPARPVTECMKPDPPTAGPEKDQEELFHILAKDEAQSIAVLTVDGDLLGVVTEDALLSAMEHEVNEDLQHIIGSKIVDPIHTPMGMRLRARLPWLLLTLAGELVIALLIAKFFHATIEKAAVLAAFMPAIMATGGNVGLQATTLVIRSLAMGRLKPRYAVRIVLGELKLGVLLGLGCGTVAGVAAYFISWGHAEALKVSGAVLLAMLSATLATSMAGTAVPILLHRMKMDPATACGPFVTMFNDMFGSLVYLLIATLLFMG